MIISSSLINKTSSYLAFINSQNRAPIFFLDQLNKLGLFTSSQHIPKDLDSTGRVHLVASLDVRVLSKTRLDFFIGVLNSSKFRRAGLVKARVLSVFSLKGRLQHFNLSGFGGFDGSPLLILTYYDYASALRPFPALSKEDFQDDEEVKEWASLSQAYIPSFVSFGGYILPFEFFKEKFTNFNQPLEALPRHLALQAGIHLAQGFQSSLSNFSRFSGSTFNLPLATPQRTLTILNSLFFSLVFHRSCQQ